jgi:hypothetical protein
MTPSKYPRTPHLPWSLSKQKDDLCPKGSPFQKGEEIVITEKMDGENTTLYRHGLHARSLDSNHHPSRTWVKRLWAEKAHLIGENFRVCGENLQAQHSIGYQNLESYFLVFSVWELDTCLSWEKTLEFCRTLHLHTVPVLYQGPYHPRLHAQLFEKEAWREKEGYVLRSAHEFQKEEFPKKVGKFVRQNHIQTDQHWMSKPIIPNKLKK